MAKILYVSANDADILCKVGNALSSPTRVKILQLLYYKSYNVKEIAAILNIPASSAALNVRVLEEANLIQTRQQPGSHGSMKICSRKNDYINIRLSGNDPNVDQVRTCSMPIGAYTNCSISPTCGLANEKGMIGYDDSPKDFFLPERLSAQILWTSSGFVEYKFPYLLDHDVNPKKMILSLELCSEAPNYKENWKSDISFWINSIECGTWTCPGDFGSRRGKLNPKWWDNGMTQFGKLLQIEINTKETIINGVTSSNVTINNFEFDQTNPILIRIGNRPDAKYIGGFNLFGSGFGDYEQDIVLSFVY